MEQQTTYSNRQFALLMAVTNKSTNTLMTANHYLEWLEDD